MRLALLLLLVSGVISYENQIDAALHRETVIVSDERYLNKDVIWSRPKGLELGNIRNAGPAQKANLYPDKYATYFVANIVLQDKWELLIRGQYPHARYFSYTIAGQLGNGQLGNGVFLNGVDIIPDDGSVNPFLPGNDRYAPNRNYTIYVKHGVLLPNSPNNTLYVTINPNINRTHLSLRTYLPDRGYDLTGVMKLDHDESGLPVVTLLLPDGTSVQDPYLVSALNATKEGDPNGYELEQWLYNVNNSNDKINAPCLPVPVSQLFWNTDYSVTGSFMALHPEQRVKLHPPNSQGGFASNPDTGYQITTASFGFGEVLVVRGKKPTHPSTYYNNKEVSSDVDLQYFSVSTGAGPSNGQGWDTVFDENIPIDSNGFYTIVVSWPWNRPAGTLIRNNVTWLSPGNGEGTYVLARNWVFLLYFRFQGQNSEWKYSTLNIPLPTPRHPIPQDAIVMGPYYPVSMYMSKTEFENKYPFDKFFDPR